MEIILPDVWEDQRTEYHRTRRPDGQLHIDGTVYYNDTFFEFYLNQQSSTIEDEEGKPIEVYIDRMRGEITVNSRKDGLKLQKASIIHSEAGERIHPKDSVLRYQCTIKSTQNKDIKNNILKDIVNFLEKHTKTIERDLEKIPLDLLSPSRAVRNYGRVYLNNRHLNTGRKAPQEKTIDNNLEKLKKLATLLDGTAMADVPYEKLVSAYQVLGKTAKAVFKTGCEFWNYCRDRGLYHGSNPFEMFYCLSGKMNEAPEDVRRRAMRPLALPESIEERFVRSSESSDSLDARDIGLVLAHDGFTAAEATSLLENAITQDTIAPGSICVKVEKKDAAGATHNYTRPLSPFAAQIVAEYLISKASTPGKKPDTEKTPLLQDGDKRIGQKNLTAYSRRVLLDLGMEEREMRADADAVFGVGIDLFQRNYKHWLQYHCGLARDHGALNFMQARSLNDVTSDNYRSFTCVDGQQYLLAAMRRDKRFWPKPENAEVSITTDEEVGHTEIFVPSADPKRFTDMEIELEIDADDWIELMSEVPLQGTIEIIEVDDED